MTRRRRTKKRKSRKKVNRSRIVSLEHSVHENKFTIKRADGTKQFIHQFNQPEKYAYYLRTYGYSYQWSPKKKKKRKRKRQKRKKRKKQFSLMPAPLTYYCRKCRRYHRINSKIGKKHKTW